MGQRRTTLSEHEIAKPRKQFVPELANGIEEWTLKLPYPEPTLKMLTRTYLADHIRQLASVLNGMGRDISEDDIAKLVVLANTSSRVRLIVGSGVAESEPGGTLCSHHFTSRPCTSLDR